MFNKGDLDIFISEGDVVQVITPYTPGAIGTVTWSSHSALILEPVELSDELKEQVQVLDMAPFRRLIPIDDIKLIFKLPYNINDKKDTK